MNRQNDNLLQPKLSLVKLELEGNEEDLKFVNDGVKNGENYLFKLEQLDNGDPISEWVSPQKRPPTPVNLPHITKYQLEFQRQLLNSMEEAYRLQNSAPVPLQVVKTVSDHIAIGNDYVKPGPNKMEIFEGSGVWFPKYKKLSMMHSIALNDWKTLTKECLEAIYGDSLAHLQAKCCTRTKNTKPPIPLKIFDGIYYWACSRSQWMIDMKSYTTYVKNLISSKKRSLENDAENKDLPVAKKRKIEAPSTVTSGDLLKLQQQSVPESSQHQKISLCEATVSIGPYPTDFVQLHCKTELQPYVDESVDGQLLVSQVEEGFAEVEPYLST